MNTSPFELPLSELKAVFKDTNIPQNNTLPQQEPIPEMTTMALGEEGGSWCGTPPMTTEIFGEEGSWEAIANPIENEDLLMELGETKNDFACCCCPEIQPIVFEPNTAI
ncbi:MAG: hypothetical protein QNJ38_08530 [Prochloraceae cyanobacterium]|nr:hypothetical protein [Prochloraceae cyanobacterium]